MSKSGYFFSKTKKLTDGSKVADVVFCDENDDLTVVFNAPSEYSAAWFAGCLDKLAQAFDLMESDNAAREFCETIELAIVTAQSRDILARAQQYLKETATAGQGV